MGLCLKDYIRLRRISAAALELKGYQTEDFGDRPGIRIQLSRGLYPVGQSRYVWGVEIPANYQGPIPEELECITAGECNYVKFCHPPYREDQHEAVTEAVWNASELWNPKEHGFEWNDEDNPVYEDDRETEGYMVIKPLRRI